MPHDYEFRWIEWNLAKVWKHGVDPQNVEYVVRHARSPWPRRLGDQKRLVRGACASGDYLQVIYLLEEDDGVFVIHARPLRDNEKRRTKRKNR